jgi:hypothetical protein
MFDELFNSVNRIKQMCRSQFVADNNIIVLGGDWNGRLAMNGDDKSNRAGEQIRLFAEGLGFRV